MELNINKIKIQMARQQLSVSDLAKVYGVSRARMNTILGQRIVSPTTAGRMAAALGVDVTEILAEE